MNYLISFIFLLLLIILVMVFWLLRTQKKLDKAMDADHSGQVARISKIITTNRPHFTKFLLSVKWVKGLSVFILPIGWLFYTVFSLFPDKMPLGTSSFVLLFCTALSVMGIITALLMRVYARKTLESLGIHVTKSASGKLVFICRFLIIIVAILMPIWILATFQYPLP